MVNDRAFIFYSMYSLWQDLFFGTKIKVICLGQGHIFEKMAVKGVGGALVFYKHSFFYLFMALMNKVDKDFYGSKIMDP